MKKAFTLAEIMIVLTLIGVLAGILIPIAVNSRPDENVAKFQKAHETLYNVINELKTSDKYYCNGDLGLKADCTTKVINNVNTRSYLCETIADVLATKKIICPIHGSTGQGGSYLLSGEGIGTVTGQKTVTTVTEETINTYKATVDAICKRAAQSMGEQIMTTDGVVYYQSGVRAFGGAPNGVRDFSSPDQFPADHADQNGFDIAYKTYCIDIDGFDLEIGSNDCDDDNDICPFGYGIRADGKIMPGARADEWLSKSITAED